jgi:pimeloyl-ACP methyl ester carboxylesterase
MKLHRLTSSLGVAVRGFASIVFAITLFGAVGCDKHLTAPDLDVTSLTSSALRDSTALDTLCARRAKGPSHVEGTSASGAKWVIDLPSQWNGDLVVYLHGYTNPAQPIALPNNGAIRDSLLALGFAVTASSYSSNGYAVPEGIHDSRRLSQLFATRFGSPRHTYLFGVSLGGLIGMILAQQFPEQYDGALLVSGIVGGSREEIQYVGDIRVLFDAVYGDVLPGGLEHPPAITNPDAQVVQPVLAAIQRNPQGVGIIQALARRPLPGANSQEIVQSLITVLGFSMQGGGDLYERTHRHSYFDNDDYRYASSALPPAVVEDINARVARYSVHPDAARFLERFGEPNGRFRIPVISLHTTRDPVVPAFHEDLLSRECSGPMLIQRLTDRYGHVGYSPGELIAEFNALVNWAGSRHKRAA